MFHDLEFGLWFFFFLLDAGCATEWKSCGWGKKHKRDGKRRGEKNGRRWRVCEKGDEEEMRFSLIFHGSYTLWIFIWGGGEACETRFIWPLTDYLFVNISHHFPLSQSLRGGLGILTTAPPECKDRSQIECRTFSLLPGAILHLQGL